MTFNTFASNELISKCRNKYNGVPILFVATAYILILQEQQKVLSLIINFLSIHTFYIRSKCLLVSNNVHTIVEQIVSSMQIIRFKKMDFFSFPSDENEWPFSPGNLLLSLRMIVRFWLSLPVTIFLRLSILFYLDFLFPRMLSTGVSGFSASGCRGFSFEGKTQGRKKGRKDSQTLCRNKSDEKLSSLGDIILAK